MVNKSKNTTKSDTFNEVSVDNEVNQGHVGDVAVVGTNPAVDATRVRGPSAWDEDSEEAGLPQLDADNIVELLTENEVAKRNRDAATGKSQE